MGIPNFMNPMGITKKAADWNNGDIIKLGTLYVNGVKQMRSKKPWTSSTAIGLFGPGDVPVYTSGVIQILDTDLNDDYALQWVYIQDDDKKLLIADRNILVGPSWDALNTQSLVYGKEVQIDRINVILRLLTGGTNNRGGNNTGGIPIDNEWDKYIVNEAGLPRNPTPNTTDINDSITENQRVGEHNQKWNWIGLYTWCQDIYSGNIANRTFRGNTSPLRYTTNTATASSVNNNGYRPVLELI